jgi:DNA-binding NarL/FixJ family response regulator
MSLISVIVADDKIVFRKIIVELLDSSKVVVLGEAENGKQLLELLRIKCPDIVLLDLEMPIMDGNKTLDSIITHFPNLKIIIISYYTDPSLVENYLHRGANGYISKDSLSSENINTALEQVKNGSIYLTEEMEVKSNFTFRQKQIIPLIFEGLTNGEIANEVFISKRAVEKQRNKIYQNSGAEKAIDFYKYAFTKGLQFLGKKKRNKNM